MKTLCIDTSGPAVIALVDGRETLAEAVEPNARRHAESLGLLLSETLEALDLSDLPSAGVDRVCVGVGPGPFTGLRAGIVFASTLGRGLGVPVLGIGSLEALARQALDDVETERASLEVSSLKVRNRRALDDVETAIPPLEVDSLEIPNHQLLNEGATAIPPLELDPLRTAADSARDEARGGQQGEGARVLVMTDAKRREVYWGIYEAKGADDVRTVSGPNVGPVADALMVAIDEGVDAVAGPQEILASLQTVLEEDLREVRGFGEMALVPQDVNPAVFPRIVDACAEDEFPLTPLYLRRPDIHGQPVQEMPAD